MACNLRRVLCFSFTRVLRTSLEIAPQQNARFLTTSQVLTCSKREARKRAKRTQIMVLDTHFDKQTRNKETFLETIEDFKKKGFKTGVVEFIYVALKRMEQYGVHEDLEVYKKLIDIMPKGPMVASNWFLADIGWYPKHQQCILMLLLQMEENRVNPDRKLKDLLISVFGKRSAPLAKYNRMQYWMPKFKNINPFVYPRHGIPDKVESAKAALKIIGELDLEAEVNVYQTKDDPSCREDTWIVSSQSPTQKKLIYYHPKEIPIYVEGPYWIYLERKDRAQYFVLRSDLPPNRKRRPFKDPDVIKNLKLPFVDPPSADDLIPEFSVHEQRDGIIFAMCITGTSSKQSLLSWVRYLETHGNSRLEEIPILFRDSLPLDAKTETKPKSQKQVEDEVKRMLNDCVRGNSII